MQHIYTNPPLQIYVTGGIYEPQTGLEPVTYALRMRRSTNWAIAAAHDFHVCSIKNEPVKIDFTGLVI